MTGRIKTIVESKAFHHVIVAVIELAGLLGRSRPRAQLGGGERAA